MTRSLAVVVLLLCPATASAAGVQLKAPKHAKATALVTFKGRAAGKRVVVQRRAGRRWRTIATGRPSKKGRFALTWIAPGKRGKVVVRAKAGRKVSPQRKVQIRPPAKGARKIKVSKKTRVIAPSAVKSIPAGGESGALTYAGGNDIHKGAIVVIGQGPDTPGGFIGRVTGVDQKNGQTVADTVPATLQQAVPVGSVDLSAKPVPAKSTRAAAKIECTGSAGASITPDLSFTSGLEFHGSWGLLSGLSASLAASASLDASVEAAIGAAGSCSLPQRSLLHLKGPSLTGAVGPVPIVITSDLDVYLDASASVEGKISTSASAGFDASAGIAYTSGGGFTGSQSFTPHFSFEPPELSAGASVGVNLTPTVDVLLYGVAGPRIALRTGVEFAADTRNDPWWTLSVPVDLTAKLAIPALDLESPELTLYSHEFPLADAGGPFGTPPPPGTTVTNIAGANLAVGYDQSCVLRPSGGVACWGNNARGQLGDGTTTRRLSPVAVSGLTDAAGIAAGNDHTCALRVHGAVKCWGDGRTTPTSVTGIFNATAVAASAARSCALLATGHVTCWGTDLKPAEVAGVTDATAIALGTSHACAVRANHSVTCWGSNTGGELGDGTNSPRAAPVQVSGITDATGVSAGANHACALRAGGKVSCWGDNYYGQLGNGGSPADSYSPVPVSDVSSALFISSGGAHTCAILSSGAQKCWGWNNYGQIGDGSTTDRKSPVPTSGITDATAVSGGLEHTCSLLASGGVSCWGYGIDGELGNGGTSNSSTPVAVAGLN